jgi:5-methyltetrahydrofolate--homocysteine methyltransferase
METVIVRNDAKVVLGPSRPTVIIGERINPTGKDWLKEALRNGDLATVAGLAKEQVAAGAQIIDVNVMVPGTKEAELLPRVVEAVQRAVDVPLCLDSSNTEALRAALVVCDGKVIINSVNGDEDKLEAVLPLVRDYKAAVIGLLTDRTVGIPKQLEQRLEIARRITAAVEAADIPRADLIVDCLTLAVGIEQEAGQVVLETIRRVLTDLDLNVSLGVSNIAFGLPRRPLFNASFIAMAAAAGMTCAIVNPCIREVREALLAADVLLGRDSRAKRFLQYHRAQLKAGQGAAKA